MPNNDVEDASDLYVVARIGDQQFESDTHWRSTDGVGSFNYRFKFQIQLPTREPFLRFYAYDRDIVTSNDFLACCQLNLTEYLNEAFQNNKETTLFLGEEKAFETI